MPITVYHHPYTRAASTVAMLEEVGEPYALAFVDIMNGEQKQPSFLDLNPMGKVPVIQDGETVVSEGAAIGLYLADRYAPGRLAPALDDPARGAYLRWSLFAPSVIEPAAYMAAQQLEYGAGQAGWGEFQAMQASVERALGTGPWLLGERFSMADLIFGLTARFMLRFKMIEARDPVVAYTERLSAWPSVVRGDAINAKIIEERGLGRDEG